MGVGVGDGEGLGGAEDAEEGTAATSHLGIEGAAVVELLLEVGEDWVLGEDGGLEVVGELFGPGLDGLAYDVTAALCRFTWGDAGIGLSGGDGDIGLDDGEVVAVEVAGLIVGGLEDLALACGKGWGRGDEEGAVGTEQ